MNNIIVLGAGGLAREVTFLIEDINRKKPTWNIIGYADKDNQNIGKTIGKYSIYISEAELITKQISVAIGIGNPIRINKIVKKFDSLTNISFPNLVHPSIIWDSKRIDIGQGNIICAGNVFTTDIQIGSYNYINLSSTFGHDVVINDCCVINPGVNVSGGVSLGSSCLVGTGAKILQYINIGSGATIGAGAVVTKDVSPRTVVVGVPAKPINKD